MCINILLVSKKGQLEFRTRFSSKIFFLILTVIFFYIYREYTHYLILFTQFFIFSRVLQSFFRKELRFVYLINDRM